MHNLDFYFMYRCWGYHCKFVSDTCATVSTGKWCVIPSLLPVDDTNGFWHAHLSFDEYGYIWSYTQLVNMFSTVQTSFPLLFLMQTNHILEMVSWSSAYFELFFAHYSVPLISILCCVKWNLCDYVAVQNIVFNFKSEWNF
jgi:hypothetical protein